MFAETKLERNLRFTELTYNQWCVLFKRQIKRKSLYYLYKVIDTIITYLIISAIVLGIPTILGIIADIFL